VDGQYQQALGMYELTLVCAVALEGHDSLDVAASNISLVCSQRVDQITLL
jgi:hypothetical protein